MTVAALQEIEVPSPRRKWRNYSAYSPLKDAWLDKAPAHWSSKRLKLAVTLINSKQVAAESGLPYVGMENIESATGRYLPGGVTEQAADGLSNSFQTGDVLFGKLRPYLAKALSATFDGLCSSELLVFRPRDFLPQYLLYLSLMDGFVKVVDSSTYGAKMPRASWEFNGNLRVPLPPLDEQQAIAAFLDRETARIDELIATKQRLIELLKEKRQAVISRAITKGLDANTSMKPSGIDWLGDIPTHWKMKRIGFLTTSQGGCTPSKDNVAFWNGDFPWVTPKDMKLDVISDSADHVTEEALRNTGLKLIPNPAVLIVVRGMILAHTFPVALTQAPVSINQDMKALKPVKTLDAEFLSCLLRACSPAFFAIVEESGHGTRVLRTDLWSKQELPIPPIEEQRNIADFVRQTTKQHDDLANKVGRAISLLNAYRSALITAAVTGQIDVRHYGKEAT